MTHADVQGFDAEDTSCATLHLQSSYEMQSTGSTSCACLLHGDCHKVDTMHAEMCRSHTLYNAYIQGFRTHAFIADPQQHEELG